MINLIYVHILFILCFKFNIAKQLNDPLQGTNPVCADVCTSEEAHVELDLSESRINRHHENVQINFEETGNGRCREPALVQIPLATIGKHGIVKFDLSFGPVLHNISIDIGFNDDTNKIIRSVNVFNQQLTIEYRSNEINKVNIFEQSVTLLQPGERVSIFISDEWISIENQQRKHAVLRVQLDQANGFLHNQHSSVTHLTIGLNRQINGKQVGIGLCLANITFIECFTDQEPALDIDVSNKKFAQRDPDNIVWISHLTYLDPNADMRECAAQGVVRLTFDPLGTRRIARFDLSMGAQVQGFTFNIGDSPTNNGYGGDGGTTSNSAEIHSNDNRFYVWANTKICDDTLLLKFDYNVIEPFDNITIIVSNERIEITNHRSYHRILHNPYLYALAKQNVTCNCFDSFCHPGVQPDNDVYFGINRVIGGTYRPGIGVCNAYVNWLQCKKIEVSPRINYEPMTKIKFIKTPVSTTESTTITTSITTTTLVEEAIVNTSVISIDVTTRAVEHANEITSTSQYPSLTITTEENNHTNQSHLSGMVTSISSTMHHFDETTIEQHKPTAESMFDHVSVNQVNDAEETHSTNIPMDVNEDILPTMATFDHQNRRFYSLSNLAQLISKIESTSESNSQNELNSTMTENDDIVETTMTTATSIPVADSSEITNPCSSENLQANLVYHEYPLDEHKFIFCNHEGKMNIIACSPNYVWSQSEQSCVLPS